MADPVVAGKSSVVECTDIVASFVKITEEVQLEANQQVASRSSTVAGFARDTNFEAAVEDIDPMGIEVVDSVG